MKKKFKKSFSFYFYFRQPPMWNETYSEKACRHCSRPKKAETVLARERKTNPKQLTAVSVSYFIIPHVRIALVRRRVARCGN